MHRGGDLRRTSGGRGFRVQGLGPQGSGFWGRVDHDSRLTFLQVRWWCWFQTMILHHPTRPDALLTRVYEEDFEISS